MDPLVSIIIPCWNCQTTIEAAVLSCIGQTYRNIEVICVLDGPNDEILFKIKKISDSRIKVISQENKGASSARNTGLHHCQGEYIQYLDADDLLGSQKIEGNIQRFREEGNSFALSLSETIYFKAGRDPETGVSQNSWPLVDHSDPVDWLVQMIGPEKGTMVQTSSWLVPLAITKMIGPWNEKIQLNDDGEYFARAVLSSNKILKAKRGKTYYRKTNSGHNLSAQKKEAFLKGGLLAIDLIAEHLFKKTTSKEAKKAISRLYKEFAFNHYPRAPDLVEEALSKAVKLGYGKVNPNFGTFWGSLLAKVIGWKSAKLLQELYHKRNKK